MPLHIASNSDMRKVTRHRKGAKWRDAFAGIPTAITETVKQTKRIPLPKVTRPEGEVQEMAEKLCDALGIRWFRIPDSILAHLHNFAPPWCRVFVSRYFKGVPDLMLFRKRETGDNITRFIEIKTERGTVSQGQRNWHRGLDVRVCYGWDEVKKEIENFASMA